MAPITQIDTSGNQDAPIAQTPTVVQANAPDIQPQTPRDILSGVIDPTAMKSGPPPLRKMGFLEGMASANPQYRATGTGIERADLARRPSVKGVLGQIVMGALQGATAGLRAPIKYGGPNPTAAGAAQAKTEALQRDQLARQKAQQDYENKTKAQEEQRAQLAAMDDHTKALADTAYLNTQTHVLANNLQHSEETYPYLKAQQELDLQKSYMDATQQFDQTMAQIEDAVGPDAVSWEHGAGYGGLTLNHAKAAGQGQDFHFLTGQHGEGTLGFGIADVDKIYNSPLKKDIDITVPVLDPSTGKMKRETIGHLKAGQPARLALAMVQAHYGEWTQALNQYATQLNGQAKQADIQKALADAGLTEAQLQNLKAMGVNLPDNWSPNPNAFKMPAAAIQQNLKSQGIHVPAQFPALWAVGHYLQDPNTFPNRPYNRPGSPPQMGKDMATSFIRTFINPNYDDKNYKAVQTLQTNFANPRSSDAGGMLIAFNTAIGHAYQLYQATDALQNNDLQALNRIAQRLNVETGQPAPQEFDAIKNALVGEIGKTFKGSAPDQVEMQEIGQTMSKVQSPAQAKGVIADAYAHLLKTKAGNLVQEYISYTGHLPPYSFAPDTVQALQNMGVDISDLVPEGATLPMGATANQSPFVPQNQIQAPPRPDNVPQGYTYKKGSQGLGWYKPGVN